MKKQYLLISAFLFLGIISQAQYTDLVDFNGISYPQGLNPYGSLIPSLTGDTLYGMSCYGGYYGAGTIFSIGANGSGYTDMYDFDGFTGAYPYGSLTLLGNMLYGMTAYGGGAGNIFSFNTSSSDYTDMYDFSGGSDGAYPFGSLALSVTSDSLYGMTSEDGIVGKYGNVFSIATDGSAFTDLFDFNGTNGTTPFGSLTLSYGVFYGMTYQGGANNLGTIFSINGDGSGYTDLLDFNGTNGANPEGSLTFSVTGDSLFGMTNSGGANGDGTVFALLYGFGYFDLLDFNGTNGASPYADLTLEKGVLYGMTNMGGADNDGAVFSLNMNTGGYTDLYDFSGINGTSPYGSLTFLNSNNELYGMTSQGGANSDGLIFGYNILTVDSFQVTNVSCRFGGSFNATAIPTGGALPYTYSWNPGGSTEQTASGLSAGSYTVTVTDNIGSTATSVAIISNISVSISQITNVICNGGSNGSIIASPSGGTMPYVYSWAGGPSSAFGSSGLASLEGPEDILLTAGTYTITVTDSCGYSASASATITQPFALEDSLVSITYPDDSGAPGSATIGVKYGAPPYTYTWSPNTNTTATATGLSAGSYSVTITDNNGCTSTVKVSTTNISFPTQPRWAKRGMYLYLDGTIDNDHNLGMDELEAYKSAIISYCASNNITYLVIFNLMSDDNGGTGNSGWVFDNPDGTLTTNSTYLSNLIDFISELKAPISSSGGGVEEVGVGYETDADPSNLGMFDAVLIYNSTYSAIDEKIDFLSLDEEYYGSNNIYSNSATDFTDVHLPLLTYMYNTAQECNCVCNGPNLRVEDFLDYSSGNVTSTELSQINTVTDRILFAEFISYLKTGIPYGISDGYWHDGFKDIGGDQPPNYRKEIWGAVSAENYDYISTYYGTHECIGYDGTGDDFSGTDIWRYSDAMYPTPIYDESEYIENLYYTNVTTNYATFPSTNNQFQILGSIWFDWNCMSTYGESIGFSDPTSAYLPFYVTVGHDQYATGSALPITATVSELSPNPPYTYTWYDMNTGTILSTVTTSSTSNTYTLPYNNSNNSYTTSKLGVVVQDNGSPALVATDYLCIYGQYQGSISALNPISESNPCLCNSPSTTLTEAPPIPGFSYSWAPSTFLNTTTGTSVTSTPTVTTTYTVTATDTYTDVYGSACGLSLTNTIVVYLGVVTPTITVEEIDADLCPNESGLADLLATTPCATSYIWDISSSPSGAFNIGSGTSDANIVTSNLFAASCTVTVESVNGCGTSSPVSYNLYSPSESDCHYDSPVKYDSSSGNDSTSQKTLLQKLSVNKCKVYPNPANEILNIEITQQTTNKIENYFYLYDNLGQVVKQELLTNSVTTVPIINLASGMYFYRIVNQVQELIKSDKLVIIH